MIVYIKEISNDSELLNLDKIPRILRKKIIINTYIKIKKKINIMTIRNIKDKIIIVIPNIDKKNICIKIKNKLELLKKKDNKKIKIVLSKKMKKYEEQFEEYQIINGKESIYYMVEDIIKYIINTGKENLRLELQDVYILSNEYNPKTNVLINYLLEKVKVINIITKQIEKFTTVEERIYNEKGIIISVADNKKKSLKKAKIIINLNLNNEEISKYNIFRNAIIINLSNNKINLQKGFSGIIINNIEIEMSENLKEIFNNNIKETFENIELYESIKNTNERYDEYIGKLKKNEVKIRNLYGNNGIIDVKEIEKSVNNLDK